MLIMFLCFLFLQNIQSDTEQRGRYRQLNAVINNFIIFYEIIYAWPSQLRSSALSLIDRNPKERFYRWLRNAIDIGADFFCLHKNKKEREKKPNEWNYYIGMTVIPLNSHTNHNKINFNWIILAVGLHNRFCVCVIWWQKWDSSNNSSISSRHSSAIGRSTWWTRKTNKSLGNL